MKNLCSYTQKVRRQRQTSYGSPSLALLVLRPRDQHLCWVVGTLASDALFGRVWAPLRMLRRSDDPATFARSIPRASCPTPWTSGTPRRLLVALAHWVDATEVPPIRQQGHSTHLLVTSSWIPENDVRSPRYYIRCFLLCPYSPHSILE